MANGIDANFIIFHSFKPLSSEWNELSRLIPANLSITHLIPEGDPSGYSLFRVEGLTEKFSVPINKFFIAIKAVIEYRNCFFIPEFDHEYAYGTLALLQKAAQQRARENQ